MTTTDAPAARTRLQAYAQLPDLAGRAFLPIAFVARLPFSMTTIGTLLLVTGTTGSLGTAGLATGAAALGTAVGGPLQGTLADRLGQRRVLLTIVPAQALAVVALVLAATGGAPTAVLLAAAALVGGLAAQVGPLARSRWMGLTRGRPDATSAAMGYESTADEIGFVLGPALVGVLATALSPAAAMLTAAALSLTFGLAFALHPTASAVPAPTGTRGSLPSLALRVAVPAAGMLALGAFFGGTQTAVTSFMEDAGAPGSAGIVYAVLGAGSAVTALCVVALPARWGARSRWVVCAAGLSLAASLVLAAGTLGGTGALVASLLVAGLFVGPVLVTAFSMGGSLAPDGQGATAMTLLASANVVGVALGSTVGGHLAQAAGTGHAFVVPVVAALALLAVGLSSTSRPRPDTGPSVDRGADVG
ncbi:putative MFS family arabinose efflux permease [Sediminihabitans luteus]|uniref:Putative MFS family arabinose efflux permease n=1 Tax=Sediminihabitans luteus TaxID=1138585 RepID=A0A2M9CQ04_9CELL|nr:MFS transporter [Sediminihabitans luteus]PJJ74012.1 putative MFS family arabinose efflux permease [Sediminihabitans luteus]